MVESRPDIAGLQASAVEDADGINAIWIEHRSDADAEMLRRLLMMTMLSIAGTKATVGRASIGRGLTGF